MRTPSNLLALVLSGFACLAGLAGITACSRGPATAPAGAWQRTDLWIENPQVELAGKSPRPFSKRISFLGAAEVRDMSKVPPQQLIAFPTRTAGQVRALEQQPGSRLKYHLRLSREPYFSFLPLGSETPCACTYRMGVRAGGKIEELYKVPVERVGPIARAAAEVDLSPWSGQEVDLLLQVDGPPEAPVSPGAPMPPVSAAVPVPLPFALWGSPAVYGRGAPPAARPRLAHPNILFIGIDTLRADAVGPFRKPTRATSLTPTIDRLATESEVYSNAYTRVQRHQPELHLDDDRPLRQAPRGLRSQNPRSGQPHHSRRDLLARRLRHHGDHLGPPPGRPQLGARPRLQGRHRADRALRRRACDRYDDGLDRRPRRPGEGRRGRHLPAGTATGGHRDRPFFAWLHLFDPHTPHTPPDPFALGLRPAAAAGLNMVPAWVVFRPPGPRPFTEAVLGGNTDLYYGEVAYTDRQVGRLLDFLDSRGLAENTIVVVVADHGENLGEHGILYRHTGLFETTTHVPLLIRWPGAAGERQGHRIEGLVQTIDLFPTLLAGAGFKPPPSDGIDLRHLPAGGRRAVFSEHAEKLGVSVRGRGYRYMLSQGNTRFFPDGPYLFDETADPAETVNLAGKGLPAERELDLLLRRWLADRGTGPGPRQQNLSDEDTKRLKSLGYN